MEIRFATAGDFETLRGLDRHVAPEVLTGKIERREVVVAFEGAVVGWLRFGFFWDSIPFMNLLFVVEENRGRSLGTRLVRFWEGEMKKRGFDRVMTSTLSNESAQHFYRKLGYADAGGLKMPDEPLEIIFIKSLAG